MVFGRTKAPEVRRKVAVMSFSCGDCNGVANAAFSHALVPNIPSIGVIADYGSDNDENGQNASVAVSAIKVNTGNKGLRSRRWL